MGIVRHKRTRKRCLMIIFELNCQVVLKKDKLEKGFSSIPCNVKVRLEILYKCTIYFNIRVVQLSQHLCRPGMFGVNTSGLQIELYGRFNHNFLGKGFVTHIF